MTGRKAEKVTVDIWEQTFEVTTHPDLFSPRHADHGTLAMAKQVQLKPDDILLDLGCGWGMVGLAAARILGSAQVTLIDIDPLAIQTANQNATDLGLCDLSVIQGDGPRMACRQFSQILCHPPYHTDFSVARHLIEDSYHQLLPDGKLWLVVKRLEWYRRKMKSVFGGVQVMAVDGYFVLMSQKKEKCQTPGRKSTTRKHLKKMAAVNPNRGTGGRRTPKKDTGR